MDKTQQEYDSGVQYVNRSADITRLTKRLNELRNIREYLHSRGQLDKRVNKRRETRQEYRKQVTECDTEIKKCDEFIKLLRTKNKVTGPTVSHRKLRSRTPKREDSVNPLPEGQADRIPSRSKSVSRRERRRQTPMYPVEEKALGTYLSYVLEKGILGELPAEVQKRIIAICSSTDGTIKIDTETLSLLDDEIREVEIKIDRHRCCLED